MPLVKGKTDSADGLRFTLADTLLNLIIWAFGSLALFLVFFLLRILLRRQWLAAVVLVALFSAPSLIGDYASLRFTATAGQPLVGKFSVDV